MKSLRQSILAAVCLLVTAVAASAQMGMRPNMPHGLFNPVVGAGAEYEMTTADGHKTTISYAIVGKESMSGKDGVWMEWTTQTGAGSGQMVMKVLVAFDGSGTSRIIMQMPGRPPMEMPAQMTGRMAAQAQPTDIRATAEDVGSESITVPAGTFTCEHYRMKDGSGDTWISSKVNPLGVVKHQGRDSTMVLTKVITDAKDKIVGVPQPFNPMMMQQAPPQQ